jgi:hypothetical protein
MKKVFVHTVKLKPPKGDVKVDICADTFGAWSAKVGLNSYETKDLQELKKWIDRTVRADQPDTVNYGPFIEIWRPISESRYGSESDLQASIIFSFEPMLLSTEVYERVTRDGKGKIGRFRRSQACRVSKNLTVELDEEKQERRHESANERDEDTTDDYQRGKRCALIPFTPARWLALKSIRDRLIELRVRLDELLVQGTAAADVLDQIETFPLLLPVGTGK